MIFGNSVKLKKLINFEIFLDRTEFSKTETAKFLGVVIDENFSWEHINNYIQKAKLPKGILKRLKYRLPENTLNTLYNTLIFPNLNYCNIIWANNKLTRLQPLLTLQKCSMRIITHSPYNTHALPLFSKLNQLTIFDLNKLSMATFMFRHHKNCLLNIFTDYFCENSTIHNS